LFEALFKYSRADFARSEIVYLGEWPDWVLAGLVVVAAVVIPVLAYRRRGHSRWYQWTSIAALQPLAERRAKPRRPLNRRGKDRGAPSGRSA